MGEEELDRLLGIVVDVENLFMCVHKVYTLVILYPHKSHVYIETKFFHSTLEVGTILISRLMLGLDLLLICRLI